MMNFESDWFRDPNAVLTAMHGDAAPGSPGSAPGITGYESLVELCRGSQAVVLLGRSQKTGERVAIKVLVCGAWISESAKRRFDREIELVSSLDHPNIVRVLDRGLSADGNPFLVMEYVEGMPLDEYVAPPRGAPGSDDERPPLSPSIDRREALRLFITICDAVSHAHQRGIMHRDLKPSNIRVDANGQPRVLDFGLARIVGDERPASLAVTVTAQFLGTPAYAAPEQFLRQPHEIDTRADVYALGVILYQIVTGRLPYRQADTIGGLIRSITGGEIVRPDQAARGLSPDLQAVILKALAAEPRDRYQTVHALADDVGAVLEGRPTTARALTRREVFLRALKQNRAVAALIAVIVIVSLGFAATTSVMALRIEQARRDAVTAEERARADAAHSQAVLEFLTGMIFDMHAPEDESQHAASQLILDRAHERMITHPPEVPAVGAELHKILGLTYFSVADSDRAIEHLRAAVAGEGFKDQPSRRLHLQLLLSIALLKQRSIPQAEEVLHQILNERAAMRDAADDRLGINQYVATSLRKTAHLLRDDVGNLDLARLILREGWDSLANDADAHQVHISIAIELAEILMAQGHRIEEAIAILQKAIAISTRLDGPDHEQTLRAQRLLTQALEKQHR